MSNVHVFATILDGLTLNHFYQDPADLTVQSDTSATFVEQVDGATVELSGADFSYDDNRIVSGEIHEIIFANGKGKPYLTCTDLKLDASLVPDIAAADGFDAEAIVNRVLSVNNTLTGSDSSDDLYGRGSDDLVFGRAGDDWINGGRGNDRLIGGDGQDVFESGIHGGHDVVTDFDVNGGADLRDWISLNASSYSTQATDKGVKILFGDHDSLLLLNLDRSDIRRIYVSLTFEGEAPVFHGEAPGWHH